MKRKTEKKAKNKYLLCFLALLGAGCIGLAITAIHFTFFSNSRTYTSNMISFNYDGIERGLNPNGGGLDIIRLKSKKLIADALMTAGLDKRYTVQDIQENLTIIGSLPQNVISRITDQNNIIGNSNIVRAFKTDEYSSTIFHIRLHNDFDKSISKEDLNLLLDVIVQEYKDYFYLTYANSMTVIPEINIDNCMNYDYTLATQYINTQLTMLQDYLNDMDKKAPSFRASNGLSFSDIRRALEVLVDTDLNKAYSNIRINSLTKDRKEQKEYYEYLLTNQRLLQVVQKEKQEAIKLSITEYEKDDMLYVTSETGLEKVNEGSSAGYDALVAFQLDLANQIAETEENIAVYEKQIANLDKQMKTEGAKYTKQIQQVESDLNDLASKTKQWIGLIKETVREYYQEEEFSNVISTLSTSKLYQPSVFSASFIISVVKFTAPFGILVLAIFAIYNMKEEARKLRKEAEQQG